MNTFLKSQINQIQIQWRRLLKENIEKKWATYY